MRKQRTVSSVRSANEPRKLTFFTECSERYELEVCSGERSLPARARNAASGAAIRFGETGKQAWRRPNAAFRDSPSGCRTATRRESSRTEYQRSRNPPWEAADASGPRECRVQNPPRLSIAD